MANTYIEPTAGTSLNTARSYFNESLRSILSNFFGSITPSSSNFTAEGAALNVPDGTLWRDSANATLKIADSVNTKSGSTFTRYGIPYRIESSTTALYVNRDKYEIGEAALIFNDGGGFDIANSTKMYVKTANSGLTPFTDISAKTSSGTYSGTVHAIKNVSNTYNSTYNLHWSRTGDVVTVGGLVQVNATAAGATEISIPLPITSTFTASTHLSGMLVPTNFVNLSNVGSISANTTSYLATAEVVPSASGFRNYVANFNYRIL